MAKILAAKLWRTGRGHVITIPAAFIKHGEVDLNKRYDVTLEEQKESKPLNKSEKTEGNVPALLNLPVLFFRKLSVFSANFSPLSS